jgi:nitroreductase/NAD-dependent dihydropyrimidine dehydrogenase PreA subunit
MTAQLPNSRFAVDAEKCVACGLCVKDCPARIISIRDKLAHIDPEKDGDCLNCQHCLAVCPHGAVSVAGCRPSGSRAVEPFAPSALENLILSRRSVRQFAPGSVDPALFRRVLDTAANAPTGVNIRDRHFTAILDADVMAAFRDRVSRALVDNAGMLPEDSSWMADMARSWLDGGEDEICRGAPHMLVVTAGPDAACKAADCIIALSYFDLYAQANGIGTTWWGIMETILRFFPESRKWLGIPDDHEIGYAMLFGPAGVHYARTAQHAAEDVVVLDALRNGASVKK